MSWGIFLIIQHQDHRGVRAFTLRERFSRWRTPAIILRSGILYYLVISGLQLGAVILYWEPQGVYSLVLNNYLTPLSTILVSRFLLDLRELIHEDSRGSSTENEPDIVFAAPSNTDTQSRHTQGRSGNGSAGERSWKKPGHSFSWYRDFEFEFEFEPDNRRSRDEECPEIQMDSMSRPLEELIQRGRLVEGRLEEGKLE
ncbi:hypothetical protein BDW22DRAFT_131794 [Trametopsis cervina]|nr:hypothetical protein BDW22DRAFT_131794 [Trametopsis cervina]